MIPLSTEFGIREAVRLLRESGRHFKSRQVAEARRLLETALTQLLEDADEKKTRQPDADAQKTQPATTDQHHN